jgi:hypothetical protein
MAYLDRTLKSLGMLHVHLTLDMQLYIIACQIKWSDPVRWNSVVLRPGMMHTLMSFIGAIGQNMKCTGVEELIGAAYSGIGNIMNGKAWPKAMRAFRMVVAALLNEFLSEGEKTHGEIVDYLEKAREHPTGKLWVDCFIIPTMLAHLFMRAEREGNWLLQQHCLETMMPYFFVSGHHHYARYISWHLRDMQHLPQDAKKDLLDGAHVCRHSEGSAAVSGDQFGEQTYIKQGKQAGGMKGISTNPEQVAVWIESLGVCSHVSMAIDDMYIPDKETTPSLTKHKEEGGKRRELDGQDRQRILDELQTHSHPLTVSSDGLININNGQVASANEVNVQDAVKIGQEMHTSFLSSLPDGFHNPIKTNVKTMQVLKKSVKVNHKAVYDLESVFARLLVVGQKRNVDLASVFQHELSPVPPSLIDEYGLLRKSKKSDLVARLGIKIPSPPPPDTLLVDASQLLYHIVWPSSGTVGDLTKGMATRLVKYGKAETYVIFDQYDGVSAKDHERKRRAGGGSHEYQMTLTSPLPGREIIMKNTQNKQKLSQLLCTYDLGNHIELVSRASRIARHNEADITLISYMLQASSAGAGTVRILSDDTDVFVLLVYWCWKKGVSCNVQMEKWDGCVLDISATVTQNGDKCRNILGMHALSGCDTVSYPNGKGKTTALKVLNQTNITGLDSVLGEEGATHSDLMATGTAFFLSLYNQKNSKSMNAARYEIYRRRKNPPALKSLPPTDVNLAFHIRRAHLQMMLWKAADKTEPPDVEITNYGWEVTDNGDVKPSLSKEPAAPDKLMDVISCSCRAEGSACSKKCGCAANGLSCTSYCVCEGGDSCCNEFTQRLDDEEDDELDEDDEEIDGEHDDDSDDDDW